MKKLNPKAPNFGGLSAVDTRLRNPRVTQWNIGIETGLAHSLFFKMFYVGTKGDHLFVTRQINPSLIEPATSQTDELARLSLFQGIVRTSTGSHLSRSNRIDPRFDGVGLVETSASSIYHGLQLQIQKRWSSRSAVQAAYTWSKSIDNISDALGVMLYDSSVPQTPFDIRSNRAVSAFDVPHRLVFYRVLELPLARNATGLPKVLFHGWSFNGIVQMGLFKCNPGFPARSTLELGEALRI
ncbi:MAG: hypothetical protein HYR55_16730 [Acidobacteria bacterium]|nr:hypothetical protein [Acidobacteriota bacterium]MBI3657429.1 hypothetical protein [Acidobacteriota bacterium]